MEFCFVMGMSLAYTMRHTFYHLTIINLIGKFFCDMFFSWLFTKPAPPYRDALNYLINP